MAAGAGRPLPLLSLLLAALIPVGGPVPAALHAQGLTIPLQCRLGSGGWQPCTMEVIDLGSHWLLTIGTRRLEFRHDGRGGVRMQSAGTWRSVSSRWERSSDLCWDGICTRGSLPLD